MVSSLEELCKIVVVILICNDPKVKKTIFSSSPSPLIRKNNGTFLSRNSINYKKWKVYLESEATTIMESYPHGLLSKLPIYLIPLIGMEIIKWAEFNQSHFDLPLEFSSNFINASLFTSKGTLDDEKAAKEMLKETNFSIFIKYKIACYYFLEDIITILWEQNRFTPDFKKKLKEREMEEPFAMWSDYLVDREKYLLSSTEMSHLHDSFLTKVFQYGITENNLSAVKYSWCSSSSFRKILNYEDKIRAQNEGIAHMSVYDIDWSRKLSKYRNIFIFDLVPYDMLLDLNNETARILAFFLHKMKMGELHQFLSYFNITRSVLCCSLHWPYQQLFLEVIDTGLLFDGTTMFHWCYGVIKYILKLIEDTNLSQSYNYRVLLREFWVKSSSEFKSYILLNECKIFGASLASENILPNLLFGNFTPDDESLYRLFLEGATAQDKNYIFNNKGKRICLKLLALEKFRAAGCFLETLGLDEKTIKTFQKSLAQDYFVEVVVKKERIELADDFIDWIVGTDGTVGLKQEILSEVFNFHKITALLMKLKISICFLNKIREWSSH